MSSSLHQRNLSEPHSYNIQAKLQNGILSIYVHDTVTNFKWRQEFTQISFPGHKLYDVAKALIMAIQQMINDTQQQKQSPSTNNHHNVDKPIAILVYNQWCYLTIHGSNLPSFALRPIDQSQPYGLSTIKENKNIKFGDTNRDKRMNHNTKFKKNSQNIAQHHQPQHHNFTNSDHLHHKNNHNKPSNTITYNKRKPLIIINKGVVARNIAKFSQQQKTKNQRNTKKTSYSSNSRKSSTKSHKKTKRNSNNKPNHSNNNKNTNKATKKKEPFRPPPTLNAASIANDAHHHNLSPPTPKNHPHSTFLPIGQRPPTPTPTPLRLSASTHDPLPFLPSSTNSSKTLLPSLPIAQKMTVKNVNSIQHSMHNNSQSLHKFGDNLAPLIHPRHNASASNHFQFAQIFKPYHQNISIPAPPVPRKPVGSPKKSVSTTNVNANTNNPNLYNQSMYGHHHNMNKMHHQKGISRELEPGQVTHLQPGHNNNGNANHLDAHSSSGSGSDYDDGIMVNTDDEDSSSYKPAMSGHSKCDSIDSNAGSLDSLFTNQAGKVTDSGDVDDDDDDDMSDSKELEAIMSSEDASETEDDEDEFSSDMFECEFSGKEDHETPRGPKAFPREYEEVVDCGIINSKRSKCKGRKKKKHSSWKLTICVNGDEIQDMFSHIIEQQIAEEEYYEEEDAMDEPFYDPNYLGINPYYDD